MKKKYISKGEGLVEIKGKSTSDICSETCTTWHTA